MPNDAVLAEYRSVRGEIEQLNSQVFAVLSSSLAVNITVLGWFFVKDNSSRAYAIPTIGVLLLFFGSIILLNRNLLAHRLAFFQEYFIESRIPDICWARVYSEYRTRYPAHGVRHKVAERLSESGSYVLLAASAINVVVLIVWGLWPCIEYGSKKIDRWQVANVIIACVLLAFQFLLGRVMTKYSDLRVRMHDLAKGSGLTLHSDGLGENPGADYRHLPVS